MAVSLTVTVAILQTPARPPAIMDPGFDLDIYGLPKKIHTYIVMRMRMRRDWPGAGGSANGRPREGS